ncbi:hypothetical protein Nepgr_024077 [Nepenthes gracilis]|uniref:F-box domain-containing protein n=1 Tax=Nepenthes gracilis TaxID=150966 RepID=A0AAD3T487_NEPGR|nr:hypothetical protein Nepgr_024077 [Nepenthes gracilis]
MTKKKKGSSKSKKTKESEKNQIENDQQLIISLLPKQLIFTEILTRLSVKPLVRCKLVSKEWESVISSPQFAKLHLRHATSSPFVQVHFFCIISLDSFHLLNYIAYDNGRTYNFSLKSLPGLDDFRFGDLRSFLIGSSNGLVCFGVHHANFFFGLNSADYADYGFYIHNPTTHLNLYVSNPLEGFKGPLTAGFGYIPSLEDYRLVILCISERSSKTLVYVYSLNSSKWRRLKAFLDIDFARSFGRGELIDGKLHWAVTRNPTGRCILRFDLVDEKFTEVPVPTSGSQFELCAIGGRLCAWDQIGGGVEVWTREQYGASECWTILLKLDVRAALDVRFVTYFQFIDAQRVLIQTDSSEVSLVDLNEYPPKYISLLVPPADIEVLSYVESLVSPLAMAEPHNAIAVLSDLLRQATITINETENPLVDKGKKIKKSSKRNKRVRNQKVENEQQLKLQSELPKQLIFTEILTRLSVKPLVRCKLVSKEWKSIISSPQFAKLHLRHATSSLFVQVHFSCIISLDTFHLLNYIAYDNGRTYNFSLKSLPGLDDFRFGDLRSFLIGSSNGLVCFGVHHANFFFGLNSADYADYGFYIHNPTTHLNLYVSNPLEGFKGPLTVGFGYVLSLDDYRLVILCNSKQNSRTFGYVYSLNSSKWGRLEAILEIEPARSFDRGELIDGKLHWVVTWNPTGRCILRFDLVDEKFTEVPVPTSGSQFELCAIGGRLCAWDQIGGGVEVWTREQYGASECWTILLKLDVRAALDVRFVTYFQFIDAQRVLIQTDSSEVLLVDLNEYPPKYISLLVPPADIEVLSYVESLVSPLAPPLNQKRKIEN